MPRVSITRRLHFCAAHRLFRPDWTDEQNDEVFGICASPNWHGHNYDIDVTVSGEVDPETGFVVNLVVLKDLVNKRVCDELDHKNLNLDVPWLDGIITSTENLVVAIWDRLHADIPSGVTLERIVLWETPRQWVEYTGG